MVPLKPVNTSNIEAIGHDPASNTLAVRFKGGSVYHYDNVPAEKHAALMAAPSIGSHFHQQIKSRPDLHPYHKQ